MKVSKVDAGFRNATDGADKLIEDNVRRGHCEHGKDIVNCPQKKQNLSPKELADGIRKLDQTARIFDKAIHFEAHDESNRWMVQVIDKETGEVIREIPPEKILDLVARLDRLVGLFVDERR